MEPNDRKPNTERMAASTLSTRAVRIRLGGVCRPAPPACATSLINAPYIRNRGIEPRYVTPPPHNYLGTNSTKMCAKQKKQRVSAGQSKANEKPTSAVRAQCRTKRPQTALPRTWFRSPAIREKHSPTVNPARNCGLKGLPQRRDQPAKRPSASAFSQVKGRYRFSQTQAIRIKHAPELRFFINSY